MAKKPKFALWIRDKALFDRFQQETAKRGLPVQDAAEQAIRTWLEGGNPLEKLKTLQESVRALGVASGRAVPKAFSTR